MRKVDEIYAEMEALQDELTTIRSKCTHPSYKVGWYSWRLGCMDPKRLCTECDEVLEGITESESAALREEFYTKVGRNPTSGSITAINPEPVPGEDSAEKGL